MCQRGQGVVQGLFETFDDNRLRGLIAWLPMLPDDNAKTAQTQSVLFGDARVTQGWDGKRDVGDLYAQMLGLQGTAWDVYLLYPPGVPWVGEQPPHPSFWMHQLPEIVGAPPKLFLDPDKLASELRGILDDAPPN